MKPIFSDNFLSHYLAEFKLSTVTDVRGKTLIIRGLVDEFETGKILSLKEEEIKSRFINHFFGDVLDFNYGNSKKWMLREEKKSITDGTKPDTALGFFSINKEDDDVRVVIEIKDANTQLDEKQKRGNNIQTPVEQAFGYASKMGGQCKWVIVSNLLEVRFYPSLDASKFQSFKLKDLVDENKLKELLYLFHKDRFIKKIGQSKTDLLYERSKILQDKDDEAIHIIDRMYYSLKRFDGLRFVDPNYIATITPFNILNEHVWHYENGTLLSLNSQLYELLTGINVTENRVDILEHYLAGIENCNVVDAKNKIEWSFKFLNQCRVGEISATKNYKEISDRHKNTIGFSYRSHFNFKKDVEGVTKNIWITHNGTCNCLSCIYRTLDLNKLLIKLKSGLGNEQFNTTEYAFGNYLTASNNFKTTYSIYKVIEKGLKGKEDKGVEYFLIKQNIKYLHNLILDYQFEDSVEILNDIKSIDLDKVIYDEIEFDIDTEVKDYLVKIKEDELVYKVQDEVEEITYQIEKLKHLYDRGGSQFSGPNLPENLKQQYHVLYLHVNSNYIIYDAFKRYKNIYEKVFRGLVSSSLTPKWGLNTFDDFFLTEAILNINPSNLKDILKKTNELATSDECVSAILAKLKNLTSSYYNDGIFGDPYKNPIVVEQLNNFRFRYNFTDIFSNLFIIISKLRVSRDQFQHVKISVLNLLKVEDELAWHNLEDVSDFIWVKGNLFEAEELSEILKISINGDKFGNSKYSKLIEQIPKSIKKYYPDYKISNKKLVQLAIISSSSENNEHVNYSHLINLMTICNDECRALLIDAFEEQLDKHFFADMYEQLLLSGYDYNNKDYFQIYSESINNSKRQNSYRYGKYSLSDVVFFNYAIVIYSLKIDFNREELTKITDLNEFESWILNPNTYDYSTFNPKWLIDIKNTIILERLKNQPEILKSIEVELKKEFDPTLAEIKYKYFCG
jgi:hypothetical protein